MEMNKESKIEKNAKWKIKQDMTIINAGALKVKMEYALSSTSSLELTLDNFEFIDQSGIKLIYDFSSDVINQGKKLKIILNLKADLIETIRLGGFGNLLGN